MKKAKISLTEMTIFIEVNLIEAGNKQPYHLLLKLFPDPKKPVMRGQLDGYPEISIDMPLNKEDDVRDFNAPENMTAESKKRILKAIKEFLDRMYA